MRMLLAHWRTRLAVVAPLLGLAAGLAGCSGPRVKLLNRNHPAALPAAAAVDIYVGELSQPHEEIAIIESNAYAYVDDATKMKQLDELRRKARKLGANAVQDVRVLSKRIKGWTVDERVPFPSWEQGKYELYFIRGMAVHVPSADETQAVQAAAPKDGWAVEKLPTPPRLSDLGPLPPAAKLTDPAQLSAPVAPDAEPAPIAPATPAPTAAPAESAEPVPALGD